MLFKSGIDNFSLPCIGLGTWGIGGFMERDDSDDNTGIDTIQKAIRLGYTHIDTAELYGAGHTEELIGRAIKDFDRSSLIITSKVFRTHLGFQDTLHACEESLKRLKTDYIDIYLIHAPNPHTPLSETMEAMNILKERGLIRYIGVSNFSVAEMQEAQKYAKFPIVVNQIPYSLATRNKDNKGPCTQMEEEIIPYCQKNNILIMAYRPIERGFLLEENAVIRELCERYKKTPAQIAMNWLLSKKNIVTIPKSINAEHLMENLGAMGWGMSESEIIMLDELRFPGYM